jgi:DNA-directed RNA polymerase sigma subunit (sigma70/sigma32)
MNMVRMGRMCKVCRLEDYRREDDQESAIETLPADNNNRPDKEVERNDLMNFIVKEIDKLNPRAKYVITQLYLGKTKVTLQDLSAQLGLSKERCRQICMDGLRRLRLTIESNIEKILGDRQTELYSERKAAGSSCRMPGTIIELLNNDIELRLDNVA